MSLNNNNLTSLDISSNTQLTYLVIHDNNLTSLDISSSTNLQELYAATNSISSLDVSSNTALTLINVNVNNLSSLDLSLNPNLTHVYCFDNDLTSLNIANGNNTSFTGFNAMSNPNLNCIQVDDVAWSTTNWTNIDATASFSLDCSVGINESELARTISIYPNPVQSQIHINSDEIIESVNIIDAMGKTIKSSLTPNNTIDVSNLPKGVYFLQVYTNKGLVSKKFVKE